MELKERFRSFLPIVVDVETGGTEPDRHALLELCVVVPEWQEDELVVRKVGIHNWNVTPYDAAAVETGSLEVSGIDLSREDRISIPEEQAMRECFQTVRKAIRRHGCTRAIATGHNAHFDLAVMKAAAKRHGIKRDPFHPFSVLDTVSLSAVAYGHTVLSVACERAEIAFDGDQAHSARYDATVTAKLFCRLVNSSSYSRSGLP